QTGTTEQALLTNHKPELHVRRRPSEFTTLPTTYCFSYVPVSDWLHIFLALERRDGELAEADVVFVRRHTHHCHANKMPVVKGNA
uniref:ABO glycosyltransferase n=1 Tax=Mesocestoides corti TaxID=53468 RepID=A0A5K3FPX2_MESCO